jgi:hypothetical protein
VKSLQRERGRAERRAEDLAVGRLAEVTGRADADNARLRDRVDTLTS